MMGGMTLSKMGRLSNEAYEKKKRKEQAAREWNEIFGPEAAERRERERALKSALLSQQTASKAMKADGGKAAERIRKMQIFNAEKFRKEIYEPLYSKTESNSAKMGSYRRGLSNSAKELADGYAEGKTLEEVKADLDARRIQCQKDHGTVIKDAEAKVEAFLEETFRLVPSELDSVLPILEHVKMTNDDVKALIKEHAGSYTALKAIERHASDYPSAINLGGAMKAYREEVEKQCRGLISTCTKGVMEPGHHESWALAASSRMQKLEKADGELMVKVGVAKPEPDALAMALSEGMWSL